MDKQGYNSEYNIVDKMNAKGGTAVFKRKGEKPCHL